MRSFILSVMFCSVFLFLMFIGDFVQEWVCLGKCNENYLNGKTRKFRELKRREKKLFNEMKYEFKKLILVIK